MTTFLRTEEAAEFLSLSVDTLLRKASAGTVPHRRIAGVRRLLWLEAELVDWINGAELETITAANGGRVTRPIESSSVKKRGGAR